MLLYILRALSNESIVQYKIVIVTPIS